MKIVFITLDFLPEQIGGGEVHAYNLAKGMQASGHEVLVIRRRIGGDAGFAIEREEFDGIPMIAIRSSESPRSAWAADDKTYEWAQSFLKHYKPEIAHVFLFAGMLSVVKAAKDAGARIVMTALDFGMFCAKFHLSTKGGNLCDGLMEESKCTNCLLEGYSVKQRLVFNSTRLISHHFLEKARNLSEEVIPRNPFLATRIRTDLKNLQKSWAAADALINILIAPSEIMKTMYVLNGFPEEKIRVLPYGVAGPAGNAAKKVKANHIRYGYIGRLHPSKGVDVLIEAFKAIDSGKAKLVLYGPLSDGQPSGYGAYLRRLAESDSRIDLAGSVEPARIGDAQNNIDVLVVPSRWYENAPLTVLEALQYGTPVICSNVEGITEFIFDGVNGLVFERNDAKGLRRAMTRLIEEPGLLERLTAGTRGIKTLIENNNEILRLYSHAGRAV